LIGLGVALSNGNPAGAQGAAFHLFNHMIMKGLAFLAVGALMYALLDRNGIHRPLEVQDLAGGARQVAGLCSRLPGFQWLADGTGGLRRIE
jgi:formate hydrogenlyase subunit 3/multisubunit Na+/H+ antiporter MnhD subunit